MLSHKQPYSLFMRCVFCGWHCSLERHSGTQGETGGNRCGCGNSFSFRFLRYETSARSPVRKAPRGIEAVIQPLEQFLFRGQSPPCGTNLYHTFHRISIRISGGYLECLPLAAVPPETLRWIYFRLGWAGQIGGIVLPGHCGPEVAQHLRNLFRVHSILQR